MRRWDFALEDLVVVLFSFADHVDVFSCLPEDISRKTKVWAGAVLLSLTCHE